MSQIITNPEESVKDVQTEMSEFDEIDSLINSCQLLINQVKEKIQNLKK